MKLCLSHCSAEYPPFLKKLLGSRAYALLCQASNYKRNPRSIEYMLDLARQLFGCEYEVIDAEDVSIDKLRTVSEIVLLWPDGNGYGWYGIEKTMMTHSRQLKIKVAVLNGRRRYFNFDRVVWFNYLLRRFAERFWLGEIFFSFIFLCTSPFVIGWDLIRGRR